jgi:hypothetical protein
MMGRRHNIQSHNPVDASLHRRAATLSAKE